MLEFRQWAGALLACAVITGPGLARANCQLMQLAEFKTDPASYRPVVDGSVDGHSVKVLIDSGAEFSSISGEAADRFGLPTIEMVGLRAYGVGGDTQLYRAHIKRLHIAGLDKADLNLLVIGDRNDHSPTEITLGDDILAQVDVEFDLAHNAVRLFKPKGCSAPQLIYWGANYSQAPLLTPNPQAPAIQSRATVNGKSTLVEIDSGATTSVLDTTAADATGVARPAQRGDSTAMQGVGRRAVQSWTGRLDSFALGDEQIAHVSMQVLPFRSGMTYQDTGSNIPRRVENTPAMFIGDDFLHAHRVFVDNEDHLILFSYEGGPVFATGPATAAGAASR
jgi:predicted aspartyl protease